MGLARPASDQVIIASGSELIEDCKYCFRSAGVPPAGARASRSREWRGQDAHAPAGKMPALVRLRAHTIREVEVLSEST